jgi:hypothetical protein
MLTKTMQAVRKREELAEDVDWGCINGSRGIPV